ncbi:hypothetical protein KY319_01485 [Candidatus Woesearchaeota archaeon]|nr:hypothetical protein [Candidatus Woesearchaeota archaeon]
MPVKPIAVALNEAKKSVLYIVLFNSIIDSLVAFMLLLLGCLLLTLPFWYAVVPALVYAFVHTYGNLKDVNFSRIEEKFPSLNEQLITVADNWKEQNEIVEALNQEVLKKMKEIKTGSFLSFGKLTRELAVMAVVSFIIVGSAAFHVEFFDLKETINEIKEFKPFEEYDINEELLEFEESQNLSEILGDKSVSELGQQQLDLELNPLKSDVEIGTVKDVEQREFREVPPPEIRAIADVSFEEEIPKQYQRIVKTYFKEITKS